MQSNISKLLATGSEETGIFGDASNHFGVVETNGRGMLHLHTLIWVRGNLGLRHYVINCLRTATLRLAWFVTLRP